LSSNSPCIDAGVFPGIVITTNTMFVETNRLRYTVTNDLNSMVTDDHERLPRPLDGLGFGQARFDIGAFEVMLPRADSNEDGIPDGWSQMYGLNPTSPGLATVDADHDGLSNIQEYVADTNPTNALSNFHIESIPQGFTVAATFPASTNRVYTLFYATNLTDGVWTSVPNQIRIPGNGRLMTLSETNPASVRFYRVGVQMP
jgi:hypothetical protein